jgi:hypothetical protein
MEPFVFDLTGVALAKLQVKSQPKHGQAVVLTNSLTTKPGVIKYSYAATGDGVVDTFTYSVTTIHGMTRTGTIRTSFKKAGIGPGERDRASTRCYAVFMVRAVIDNGYLIAGTTVIRALSCFSEQPCFYMMVGIHQNWC